MDVREMQYEDNKFDVIIDKSTIDTLLCGNYAYLNVSIMLKECQRVLKTGGVYVAISYSPPEYRENHLRREHLNFDI
jgi:ubiquinone/menaquinone biosynthesis C-methylase UbiE